LARRPALEMRSLPGTTLAVPLDEHHAAMTRAFGGYGERVTESGEIVPAVRRAIAQSQGGLPALLELITAQETEYSLRC
jgi:acetolactate synthase-1/2/3 large subunit